MGWMRNGGLIVNSLTQEICAALGLLAEELRLGAEMTKAEVATRAGLAASTVGNFERGAPSLVSTLVVVSAALGVEPEWMLDEAKRMVRYTEGR